jgi:hypothetical protein
MPARVPRYDHRIAAYTRRGRGRAKVGPICHTCGGAGVWFDDDEKGGERRPRICRECPAFYTKGRQS